MSWKCPKCYKSLEEQPDVCSCGRVTRPITTTTVSERVNPSTVLENIISTFRRINLETGLGIGIASCFVLALVIFAIYAGRHETALRLKEEESRVRWEQLKAQDAAYMEELKRTRPEQHAKYLEIMNQSEKDRRDIERLTGYFRAEEAVARSTPGGSVRYTYQSMTPEARVSLQKLGVTEREVDNLARAADKENAGVYTKTPEELEAIVKVNRVNRIILGR